ncbi:MAG: energy transducer TonB [Bacteroidetes bacterium]|nr:energy transducer TonB [Bacteroidota bacterium]MBK8330431.1 energy transducer TonB [Bacteroidota bacterium]MBK9481883.1 energy transducer TonB [Bacteroidota bacterium]
MKLTLLILVFNLIVILGIAQHRAIKYDSIQKLYYKTDGKDSIFFDTPPPNVVLLERNPPVFIGNMERFIKDNLVYPEEASKRNLEGYVNLYCPIDSNGVPSKIVVMYASSPLFENEAKRIVSLMRWRWDKHEPYKEHWAEHLKIVFQR